MRGRRTGKHEIDGTMRYLIRQSHSGFTVFDSVHRLPVESFGMNMSNPQRAFVEATALCRALNAQEMPANRTETPLPAPFGPEPRPYSICERCGWGWAPIPGGTTYLHPQGQTSQADGFCPGCEADIERELE